MPMNNHVYDGLLIIQLRHCFTGLYLMQLKCSMWVFIVSMSCWLKIILCYIRAQGLLVVVYIDDDNSLELYRMAFGQHRLEY